MKTLRISDDAHQKLTGMLGEITAQTMKMQTYTDAIENNKQLGYTTREEFIRDAIRFKLRTLNEQYECIEVPKEDYEKLQQAIQDMDTPFRSVDDFIDQQIQSILDKHAAWKKQKEIYEKR